MANSNFPTALASTTIANYRKTLIDNVFTDRVLTWYLSEKNRINFQDGGLKIVQPLIYAQNSTVASYQDYDTVALTAQDGMTAAEFAWKQLAVSIAISGMEEAKNNGEAQLVRLLEAKIMQAEETLKQKFNTMFYADGTGNSGKDWDGLTNIVNSLNTVGGINGTTDSYWNSYVDSTATALTEALLRTAYNSTSVGSDQPDIIITTRALFEKYEGLLTPQTRYADVQMANLGFQNLMFKGAPVTFDVDCPSGTVFLLNSKYLELVGHTDTWFKQTDFIRPENMDARYSLILSYGNLTCTNRKRQGKLTAKT